MSHIGFFANRWIGIRMMIINITFIGITYASPLFFATLFDDSFFERSLFMLAFATSWSLKLNNYFNTFFHTITKLETEIISYGRLTNYLENVQSEANINLTYTPKYVKSPTFNLYSPRRVRSKDCSKDSKNKQVALEIRNTCVRIQQRQILRGINLKIYEGEKIILIGREGSGKNSLLKLIESLYTPSDSENNEIDEFQGIAKPGQVSVSPSNAVRQSRTIKSKKH